VVLRGDTAPKTATAPLPPLQDRVVRFSGVHLTRRATGKVRRCEDDFFSDTKSLPHETLHTLLRRQLAAKRVQKNSCDLVRRIKAKTPTSGNSHNCASAA
jgi:hypothetical protein